MKENKENHLSEKEKDAQKQHKVPVQPKEPVGETTSSNDSARLPDKDDTPPDEQTRGNPWNFLSTLFWYIPRKAPHRYFLSDILICNSLIHSRRTGTIFNQLFIHLSIQSILDGRKVNFWLTKTAFKLISAYIWNERKGWIRPFIFFCRSSWSTSSFRVGKYTGAWVEGELRMEINFLW